jgi:hypothetical protein
VLAAVKFARWTKGIASGRSEPNTGGRARPQRTHRYSIAIKDAKGSIVFATAAFWDGDDRRTAVAKILRLNGVLDAPSSPSRWPGRDEAVNLNVEKMAASFAITTPVKKKPRH